MLINMKVNLNSGAYIEIGGELGKYNSLPVDVLVKIAKDLQNLIISIAKHTLSSDEPIDLNNFQIELTGFEKGSAVPKFSYSPRAENKVGFHWSSQRDSVNSYFNNVLLIANSGDYSKLKTIFPTSEARNPIVEDLYSFTSNFKNSPVSFVNYNKKTKKTVPIYKVNKFKEETKKELIAPIFDIEKIEDKKTQEVAGIIKLTHKGGKVGQKIIRTFKDSFYNIEYAPDIINAGEIVYHLRYPLRAAFKKEDNYYIIQSEILDIIGTGLSEPEAEKSFAEEFNFIFQRLNTLNDDQLTEHNKLIKMNIKSMVLKIES